MPQKKPATMDLTPEPAILEVLGAVDIEDWRCVAELTDNALDNFRKNKISPGIVNVELHDDWFVVRDNGTGMTHDQCENALKAGYSDKTKNADLGLFGVGFNVACARLGNVARVYTKLPKEDEWLKVEIDLAQLKQNKNFNVQPEYVTEPEFGAKYPHGTVVAVKLKSDMKRQFSRRRHMTDIAKQLGDIYSFILRDKVPGLTGKNAGEPREIEIFVGDDKVNPRLPCIWAENRNVQFRGVGISAIQRLDQDIGDGWVCQDCGHWHDRDPGQYCEECESINIDCVERKITGWVGVQRYLHETDYGLDFIRNGRKILVRDKDIFQWRDPNSGGTGNEYPIEMPANRGRIVGEIHCDHVPVDFRKTGFQESRMWDGAIACVKGDQPLRTKKEKRGDPNNSPLAKIFSAFRRNDPGLRCLIPGDGKQANHERGKNWGVEFHSGKTEYQQDTKWYEAATFHDDKKKDDAKGPGDGGPIPIPPGSPNPTSPLPPEGPSAHPKPPRNLSDSQKMELWKAGGRQRHDLSTDVNLPENLGSWSLDVWETALRIERTPGTKVATICISGKGNTLHIFADSNHDTFKKFGRRIVDLILLDAATIIKAVKNSEASATEIFGHLLQDFPDEQISVSSIKKQIPELTERLKKRLYDIIPADPKRFWDTLDVNSKNAAEENAGAIGDVEWGTAVQNGDYILHLSMGGIRTLIKNNPLDFFGGTLFKQFYPSDHAANAQQRILGAVSTAFEDLEKLENLNSEPTPHEISLCGLQLGFINQSLVPLDS
jgi:hypothetical protein